MTSKFEMQGRHQLKCISDHINLHVRIITIFRKHLDNNKGDVLIMSKSWFLITYFHNKPHVLLKKQRGQFILINKFCEKYLEKRKTNNQGIKDWKHSI